LKDLIALNRVIPCEPALMVYELASIVSRAVEDSILEPCEGWGFKSNRIRGIKLVQTGGRVMGVARSRPCDTFSTGSAGWRK